MNLKIGVLANMLIIREIYKYKVPFLFIKQQFLNSVVAHQEIIEKHIIFLLV